ncbi:hypothetical protein ACKGJN_05335 [Gillisia sp. Q332]|uniref:hypothetical protein n=1 Tax=Gillisia xinjiangensis TaxID=3384765 RepID=UPI00391BBB1A
MGQQPGIFECQAQFKVGELPRGKPTRHPAAESFLFNENPSVFKLSSKNEARLGELNPKEIKENPSPDTRLEHILKDEMIELTGIKSKKKFPKKLRRVAIWDDKNKQVIEVITNQKTWTANTISELYKSK